MAVTADVIIGNQVLIYVDGEAIACTTGASFNGTNNQIETTCKDYDGAVTYAPGSTDWSISINANSKFDAATGLKEMAALFITKTTVTARMATGNTDDPYVEGEAFVSAWTWDNPVNAPSTWTATLSPRGPIRLFNT